MEPTNQNTPTPNPSTKKSSMPLVIVALIVVLAILTAGVVYWSDRSDNTNTQDAITNTESTSDAKANVLGEADVSTLKAEEVVSVSIYVDSGDREISVLGTTLSYPQESLEFLSIDGTSGSFPTVVTSKGGDGSVVIESGITPGEDPVTGKNLVAIVKFKSLGGSGEKEISFVEGTKVIDANTFEDVLGETQSIKLTLEEN